MINNFYLKKLKEKIFLFINSKDEIESEKKIEELIFYYNSLLKEDKKNLIFIYYSKIIENYVKIWFIDLLVNSILINNNLFINENIKINIIKNKENIKDYINKQLSLFYINSVLLVKIINNKNGLNVIKNKNNMSEFIFNNIKKTNEILKEKESQYITNEIGIFNYFLDFKKNLFIKHEKKIFDLINENDLFIINNDQLLISKSLKDFLFVIFNISVIDKPIKIKNINYNYLKKEFKKIFLINKL